MLDDGLSVRNFVGLIFAALLLFAFAAGMIYATQESDETAEERMDDAVQVEAEILETDIDQDLRRGDGVYYPTVRFEYTYEGERYESNKLKPTQESTRHDTRSGARSVTRSYPEGETTTAYVDPTHPDKAFLEEPDTGTSVIGYVGSGLAILVGITLIGGAVYFRPR